MKIKLDGVVEILFIILNVRVKDYKSFKLVLYDKKFFEIVL